MRPRRSGPFHLRLALGASVAAGCGSPAPPAGPPAGPRPDVVLITVETLRPDRVGPLYGHARDTMPALSGLGLRGRVYEAALSSAPWTLPSLASLATGLPVPAHTLDRVERALPEGLPTLAEAFAAAGYDTAFFGVNPVLLVPRGLDRGFGAWWADRGASAGRLHQALRGWLEAGRRPGAPVFVHLHYFEPHCPYRPPDSHAGAFVDDGVGTGALAPERAVEGCYALPGPDGQPLREVDEYTRRYDAELLAFDAELARGLRMMAAAGLSEGDVFVVTADHGELFGEGGGWGHSQTLRPEELRVPLVVVGPGIPPGRDGRPISHLDLHAWLRQIAAGGAPAGPPSGGGGHLAATDAGPTPQRAWITEAGFLVRDLSGGAEGALSWAGAPIPTPPGMSAALDAALAAPAPPPRPLVPTAEELEQLRALGYVF